MRSADYTEILLQNKWIHFLGTDTHRQGYIYENIDEILKKLKSISGNDQYINEITTYNPKKIIQDIDILIDDPEEIIIKKKKCFSFYKV